MLEKKYLKELYTMNQDIKKIFDIYYVFDTGFIFNSELKKRKGVFVESNLYERLYKPNHVITVHSLLLFQIFKNYKMSEIEGLEIRGNDIGAVVNGDFNRFAIYCPINETIDALYKANSEFCSYEYDNVKNLDSETIMSMMNKESVNITLSDRRVILCKSVLPTIKKTSKIKIESQNHLEDNIFYCKISMDNSSGCIINHTIRCLNV